MADSSLMGLIIKRHAATLMQQWMGLLQIQRADLAEQIGTKEATDLIEEVVSSIRQIDTANAGKFVDVLLEISAIGAVKSFMEEKG